MEDFKEAEELAERYATNQRASIQVRNDFEEFANLNGLSLEEAVKPYVGQTLRAGLKPSSLDTYLGYLKPLLRRFPAYYTWCKIVALAHADSEAKTAVDASLASLKEVLKAMEIKNKPIVWFLISTGMRVADARRLRRKQISLTKTDLVVQCRIMKNRRKRRHRFVLRIPVEWSMNPPPSFRRLLSTGDDEQCIFGHYNVASINALLKPWSLSSYTFRRRFFKEVVDRVGLGEMRLYTGHFSESIFQAHYQKWTAGQVTNENPTLP